jgi:endonuclease YncB( thermonuclease family)
MMGSCTGKPAEQQTLEQRLEGCSWNTCEPYVPEFTEGKIIKCYDGDTVTIATVLHDKVVRFNIRMLGYDCAEIKSKNLQEKQVAKWAKAFITDLIYGKMVKIAKNDGYDKYGRLLLELEINGVNVNHLMLQKWGVEYQGGHKETVDWSAWTELGRT